MRHTLSENDARQSTRRRRSDVSTPASDPGELSRGGNGSLMASSHGPSSPGVFRETGGIQTSMVEVCKPRANRSTRYLYLSLILLTYCSLGRRAAGEL